jgi:integrative and conjugative element protein (TIGR02256 family)
MRLILQTSVIERLSSEVRRHHREIGGILVGEHVADNCFRVVDASVQTAGGTFSRFVRDQNDSREFLDNFFERTKHDYKKFNYIGEWHSHPWFSVKPSAIDQASMIDTLNSVDVGANFLILLILGIGFLGGTKVSTTLFQKDTPPCLVKYQLEESSLEPARKRKRVLI